jgi:proline dehydrogenase
MSLEARLNATKALKSIAASEHYRALFAGSVTLRSKMRAAALRYIISEDRGEMFERLSTLDQRGYSTGIEFAGEEALTVDEVNNVTAEYLHLIKVIAGLSNWTRDPQLGFDLSNVGSGSSRDLAIENCSLILEQAQKHNISVIISMERSKWTDLILDIFAELSKRYTVIGITMQAQLHRTSDDLIDVLKYGRKIRLVKGVYDEDPGIALPRGQQLNARYLDMIESIARTGNEYSYATQDPYIVENLLQMETRESFHAGEIEMLHGVNPPIIQHAKSRAKKPPRVSAVYGTEWFLHLLHRIAEYPENIYLALADVASGQRPNVTKNY